jgi:hypothetical protein
MVVVVVARLIVVVWIEEIGLVCETITITNTTTVAPVVIASDLMTIAESALVASIASAVVAVNLRTIAIAPGA